MTDSKPLIQIDPRRLLGVRIIVDSSSPADSTRLGSKVGGKPQPTPSILSAKIGTKIGQKQLPR